MGALHTIDGRWQDAVDVYQKALDRDPSQAWGHIGLANILTAMGRWQEAEATARDGLKVAPLLSDAHNEVMRVLANSRRRDESLPFLVRSLELDPGHVNTRFLITITLAWMGRCQDSRGPRLGEIGIGGALAEAEYLLSEACPDLPVCVMVAAYAFHRCQRTEDARQLYARAEALAEGGYFPPAVLARIRLIVGDREGALEALEAALEVRDPSLRFVTNGTWNRTLRGDPRFETIVDRLGLPREKDWTAADPMGIEPSTPAMEEPQPFPGS